MANFVWLEALKRDGGKLRDAMGLSDGEFHDWLKTQYKRHGSYALKDRLTHGIGEGTLWQRIRQDGEGWVAYGFVLGEEFSDWYDVGTTEDLSDRDISEWLDGHVAYHVTGDWDCTGKAFTRRISWHRNPDGAISFVHHVGIDV